MGPHAVSRQKAHQNLSLSVNEMQGWLSLEKDIIKIVLRICFYFFLN